jgi:signal transduction histidine kinase
MVYNSANNTLVLLDNLLLWAIAQNKEKNFSPVKIDLYKLLSEEIDSLKTMAAQKHIEIYTTVETDLNVAADLQMLKTIIRNLISNAIKYSHSNGVIAVNTSKIDQSVEISVSDNGIGISEDDQKKLFKIDKFHTTPGTHNESGTGLGLLLCKEFAELHGSSIRIHSNPGGGSRFAFSVPHFT